MAIDPSKLRMAVAGNGALALRRLRLLQAGGGEPVLYAPDPAAALRGVASRRALPDQAALRALNLLWIADLAPAEAAALAAAARSERVLVNHEDVPDACDFFSMAEVRRGDLLLTVSTGGAAPGLARVIRRHLETMFSSDWAGHVREVAEARRGWRAEGVGMAEVARRTENLVAARGWLAGARGNESGS